ncbi:MAG: hypothetical protein JNK05_34700 [Myxococcales bacterium]|nr:hypothetical protein [Myxococcales bacterium]
MSDSGTTSEKPGPGNNRRKTIGLVVALGGALFVGRILASSAPRDVRVTVGLSDHRDGVARAERVSVSFAKDGDVLQRAEERFGEGRAVPARWARVVSLVPGRYRVRVELVSGQGLLVREEDRDVGPEGVDLGAPRQ